MRLVLVHCAIPMKRLHGRSHGTRKHWSRAHEILQVHGDLRACERDLRCPALPATWILWDKTPSSCSVLLWRVSFALTSKDTGYTHAQDRPDMRIWYCSETCASHSMENALIHRHRRRKKDVSTKSATRTDTQPNIDKSIRALFRHPERAALRRLDLRRLVSQASSTHFPPSPHGQQYCESQIWLSPKLNNVDHVRGTCPVFLVWSTCAQKSGGDPRPAIGVSNWSAQRALRFSLSSALFLSAPR